MKKIISIGIAMLAIVITCKAQWTTSGSDIYNSNTGNVGIGISSPRRQLSVGSYLDIYSGGVATTTTPSIRASSSGNLILNAFGSGGNIYLHSDHGSGTVYVGTSSNSTKIAINGATNGNSYFNSGGSLGINTTSPESGFKLDVNGLGAIGTQASARIYMGTVDATHAVIQSRDNSVNQNLNFSAASYNFDVGNVGIGTANPQSKLHVYQSTPDLPGLVIQGNTINVDGVEHYIALTMDGDYGNATGNYSQIRSYSNLYSHWGSQLAFFTTQAGVTNALSERMRIDANGNVGIGTTNPTYSLHINKPTATLALDGIAGGLGNSGAVVNLLGWAASNKNWQIGVANIGGAGLNFTTSTTIGGSTFTTPVMTIADNGSLGIGTITPAAKLDIENGVALINNDALAGLGGQVTISNNYGNQNGAVRLNLNNGGAVSWIKGIVTGSNTNTGSAMAFGVPSNTSDGTEAMRITGDGNMAIGTTDPKGHKLAVNGDIIATKITVMPYGSWPDYVFKPQYYLPPLSEVKSFIDKNQHLPGMPSENEVAKDGINLGEIVKLQTKKIEELTLYLIEKDKQVNDQNNKLSNQQKEIDQLKQSLEILIHKN